MLNVSVFVACLLKITRESKFALLLGLSIFLGVQASPAAALQYNFQQGVVNGTQQDAFYDVEDTTLHGCCGNEAVNFGSAATHTTTRPGSGNRHPIFRYDLSAIPENYENKVLNASFTFEASGLSGTPRDYIWTIYELPEGNTAWSESTATYNNQVEASTPWINASGALVANAFAAGLTGRVVGTVTQTFLTGSGTVTIDLDKDIVEEWVKSTDSLPGFWLRQENITAAEGGNGGILSSESAFFFQRPLLSIEATVPEPSSAVLLCLGMVVFARVSRRGRKQ